MIEPGHNYDGGTVTYEAAAAFFENVAEYIEKLRAVAKTAHGFTDVCDEELAELKEYEEVRGFDDHDDY
jgi:hypothetical protein